MMPHTGLISAAPGPKLVVDQFEKSLTMILGWSTPSGVQQSVDCFLGFSR